MKIYHFETWSENKRTNNLQRNYKLLLQYLCTTVHAYMHELPFSYAYFSELG